MKITQTIIPAAGLGTRFLPFTKSVPKELLPIMETPALQFIIKEGLKAGINSFTIVANDNKHAIRDYFSHNIVLENHLEATGKIELLHSINAIINRAQFTYVPQEEPLGLGHAIKMAQKTITSPYFGIMLPDELMFGDVPALAQLIAIAQTYQCSVIAVQEVPSTAVSSYGVIAIKKECEPNLFEIERLVEKPAINDAPSNLAIIGRYILSERIFSSLEAIKPGAHNEFQLTDAIMHMLQNGERVLAYKVDTIRHDIGNPLGWLNANIFYGLSKLEYTETVKKYLQR